MPISHLFCQLAAHLNRPKKRALPRKAHSYKPRLERLEERTFLSAGAVTNGLIAFTSDRDGQIVDGGIATNTEIYTMNADGTGQTRLTNHAASDVSPAWSPDGSKIAFASGRDGNREIYVMNLDGTDQTRLTNHPKDDNSPAWSPDGSKLAFNRGFEIYVMNADGTGQTNVSNHPNADLYPAWSPDGSKIAFVSDRDHWMLEIYVMNADGTGQTRLTIDDGMWRGGPAWSPDGSKIAFESNRDGGYTEIYVMNPDGTEQTRLTKESGRLPAWSPDGSKIAFITKRDGTGPDWERREEIYVMNADGTGQTRLTNHPAYDSEPDWQPVLPNDNAPVAQADTFRLGRTGVSITAASSVLANDTDADGNALRAVLIKPTLTGTIHLSFSGVFTFTPGPDYWDKDSFTYQASDGAFQSQTVTVTLISHDAQLVEKLYQQVLGRAPDEEGWRYWTQQLMHGAASLGTLASGIFESPERLNPIIAQMYRDYLFREADESGLSFWRARWQQDGGPDNVIAGIVSSEEFFRQAGSNNRAWVEEMYHRLLKREPDEGGAIHWEEKLNSGALERWQVVLGFVQSEENFLLLVREWYGQYLQRSAGSDEEGYFVSQLVNGQSPRAIQIQLLDSAEYRNSPLAPPSNTAIRV